MIDAELRRQKRNEYARKWREANKDRVNARVRELRPQKSAIIAEQKRAYYERNKPAILDAQREYTNDPAVKANRAEVGRRYREANREKLLAQKRADYAKNRDRYRQRNKEWKLANPDHQRQWVAVNREHLNAKRRVSRKQYLTESPQQRAAASMRSRVWALLKKSGAKKIESLGLEAEPLRVHLEAQFVRGMSWANYGTAWHVDHVIPCTAFNLTDPIQLRQCFAYLNLRPMWAADNIRKGDEVIPHSQIPLGI